MDNFGVDIKEIKELSFYSNLADYNNTLDETIEIDHEISIKTSKLNDDGNPENDELSIIHTIIVNSSLKDNKPKDGDSLITLKVKCTFTVEKLVNLIESQEGNTITKLKSDLLNIILTTSVGTIRGMLSYKTASLPINIILPVMDVAKMVGKSE
jgi:hypothetical protein